MPLGKIKGHRKIQVYQVKWYKGLISERQYVLPIISVKVFSDIVEPSIYLVCGFLH